MVNDVGDGDGDKAATKRGRVRVARAMVMLMRVAGDEEAMVTATMVAGERW